MPAAGNNIIPFSDFIAINYVDSQGIEYAFSGLYGESQLGGLDAEDGRNRIVLDGRGNLSGEVAIPDSIREALIN